MPMSRPVRLFAWSAATVVLLTAVRPLVAVKTSYWVDENVRAFATGTRKEVVISSRGIIRLSREARSLLADSEDIAFVNALAEDAAGNLYAATGPKGIILKITPDGKA